MCIELMTVNYRGYFCFSVVVAVVAAAWTRTAQFVLAPVVHPAVVHAVHHAW